MYHAYKMIHVLGDCFHGEALHNGFCGESCCCLSNTNYRVYACMCRRLAHVFLVMKHNDYFPDDVSLFFKRCRGSGMGMCCSHRACNLGW